MWGFLEKWKIIVGVFRGEKYLGINVVEYNTHYNIQV
jgi:hypothetical protein